MKLPSTRLSTATLKITLSIAALSLIAGGFFIFNTVEVPVHEKEKGPNPDRPDLALEQEIKMTQDLATGTVPRERLADAWAMIQQQKAQKNNPNPLTVANWTERGPSNVGGRTRAIMFDPNDGTQKKVWAGGVGGGLWYTNDITVASPVWVSVDDFWANLAVSCIAYDPSNTQVFYVGTGEGWYNVDAIQGAGIWKTTDGGATWAQLSSTNNATFYNVQKIVVESTGVLYAATRAGGVRRSTNGGTSWTQVVAGAAADLEISAGGTLFATIGIFSTGGIYKSTDGTTWSTSYSSAAGEYRIEIACAPSDANTLYAMVSQSSGNSLKKIMKSTNGGTSWSSVTLPTWCDQGTSSSDMTRGQAWYDLILAVDPNNASTAIAGGVDLMKTTDAGTNWSQITRWSSFGGCPGVGIHADQHAFVYRSGSSSVAVSGNDGGIYYTADGGSTFANKNTGYNVTQFYACAMNGSSGSNYFLAGAQDNGTQKFTTAGMNSTTQATGGDGAYCHIDQTNSTYQLTAYVYNYVYRSTNGGTSFSPINTDQSNGDFINPSDYDDANGILYSSYSTSQLNRISGIRGTPSAPTQITVTGMTDYAGNILSSPYAPGGTTTLFVGTQNGKLFKVTNAQGTPSTTNITGPSFSTGTISCIALGASESDILVTFSNYGVSSSVWRTTDGGSTWSNKDNATLPDMPIRWIIYNPNNYTEVLLATEVGVWSTNDVTVASPTWAANVTGLANVRVDMFQYRSADQMLIAATHGRGLFSSDVFVPGGGSPPVAAFSGTPTTLCAGSSVVFTDASTNTPTSWSWTFQGGTPSASTSQNPTVTYNTAGTYSVSLTATNADGSDNETKLSYITVNARPSNSASVTNVSCNGGSDGAIDLSVSSGTSPYTYSWNPGGQTTQDRTSVTAGTYTVLTTDSKGCTDQDAYTVTEPSVLSVSMSKTDATCTSSNGSATATASGGTTPYTYSWNPGGATTSAISNIASGTYTCTVTDNKACGAIGTVSVGATPCGPTKLVPSHCGITLTTFTQTLYCVSVTNATNYQYRITHSASGFSSVYTRGNYLTNFQMAWVSGVQYGKTYDVEVRAYVSGVWSNYGNICTVTTPASMPSTKLSPAYCGITLTALNQTLYCDAVTGATNYEYRLTETPSGPVLTYIRGNYLTNFQMVWVSGVKYGKTYNVDVRAYVGGVWGSYGTVCSVTTPAFPTTKIRTADCGATLPAVSTTIYCDAVSGAANYEYKVENISLGFSKTFIRLTYLTDFKLSWVSGTAINTTYDVSVHALVGGVWGSYGTVCQVTTGPVMRLAGEPDATVFSLNVFPNPVTSRIINFTMEGALTGEEIQIDIYDMLGLKVYSEKIIYSSYEAMPVQLNDSFHAGVYLMNVVINNRKLYQKFVIPE